MFSTIEQIKQYIPGLYEDILKEYEGSDEWTGVRASVPIWSDEDTIESLLLYYTKDKEVDRKSNWHVIDLFNNYETVNDFNKIVGSSTSYMEQLANMIRRSDYLNSVMTTKEAEIKWNLPEGTIRRDIARGKLGPHMVRKSWNTWLVTAEAMREVYKVYTNDYYTFSIHFTDLGEGDITETRSVNIYTAKNILSIRYIIPEMKRWGGTEYKLEENTSLNQKYKDAIKNGLNKLEWVISKEQYEELLDIDDILTIDYTHSMGLFKNAVTITEHLLSHKPKNEEEFFYQTQRMFLLNLCQSLQENYLDYEEDQIIKSLIMLLNDRDELENYIKGIKIDSHATSYLLNEFLNASKHGKGEHNSLRNLVNHVYSDL